MKTLLNSFFSQESFDLEERPYSEDEGGFFNFVSDLYGCSSGVRAEAKTKEEL